MPLSVHEDNSSAPQYHLFKDSLAQALLARIDGAGSGNNSAAGESDLDDFSSYLCSESWPTLSSLLQTASHESRNTVPNPEDLPLDATPLSFIDTLIAYGITSDAEESLAFLRGVLTDYIQEACAPPPIWSSTRTTECEICQREVPLTYHHLIPRSTHAKVLKRKWHPESMLNSVAWLCR
ncbi:hypothetical protein APHAL10511_008465 [Amanita phalloides]|nr:hypothetical protein APHAL10511_008465 [Amanita phalloides]